MVNDEKVPIFNFLAPSSRPPGPKNRKKIQNFQNSKKIFDRPQTGPRAPQGPNMVPTGNTHPCTTFWQIIIKFPIFAMLQLGTGNKKSVS